MRATVVETESRNAPAPAAVAVVPTPEVLGAQIRELGHLLRVTTGVIRRFSPAVVLDELSELVDRRVRGIEEALGKAAE